MPNSNLAFVDLLVLVFTIKVMCCVITVSNSEPMGPSAAVLFSLTVSLKVH